MCLFEIGGAFYSIRDSLEKSIGPAASTLLYLAGIQGGKRFASSAGRIGMIKVGTEGLADCIEIFSQAGFGNFFISDADWREPRVIVECDSPAAFEAFAFKENKNPAKGPVCDYARGVFAGFYQELTKRGDIMCLEVECRASGSRHCVFEIGQHDKMMTKAMGVKSKK
jgi:predicted hydrocarbon binding protein